MEITISDAQKTALEKVLLKELYGEEPEEFLSMLDAIYLNALYNKLTGKERKLPSRIILLKADEQEENA